MKKKTAFTLAEVLITLAVIGVVAVLAIGIFIPKIQDKVLAAQAKTAKIKFTKAMEQMALNNKIGPLYQDTEEFVSELQNYLKVAKVCDADKLSDCFGYESFVDADNETIELSELKDGRGFNLPISATSDFTGSTMGLVTIDGTPMILSWNKKCDILEPGVYEWSGDTNKSTNCVAALMDVNGTKRPEKLGKDITLLNAFNVGAAVKFTVNGVTYKWGPLFSPTPMTNSQCNNIKSTLGINKCSNWDYWAGAVKACGGTNNLPSLTDLAAFATYLYGRESNPIGEKESIYSGITLDETKLSSLNTELFAVYAASNSAGKNRLDLWSGQEYSDADANGRLFKRGDTAYVSSGNRRYNDFVFAVCKLQ